MVTETKINEPKTRSTYATRAACCRYIFECLIVAGHVPGADAVIPEFREPVRQTGTTAVADNADAQITTGELQERS